MSDYDEAHMWCPDCSGWGWRECSDTEGNEWNEPCDHLYDTGKPGSVGRSAQ